MEKLTSIIAALNAGQLPSTQQLGAFIDYLEKIGIVSFEQGTTKDAASTAVAAGEPALEDATRALSAQGRVLADDLREVLRADRKLLNDKNADNALQLAIWHITQGTVSTTEATKATHKAAHQDIETLRRSLHTLLKSLYHSFSDERSTLLFDFLSLVRTSLSDALEAIEGRASQAKHELRKVESEVQGGKRDALGRDKGRLEEEERDAKLAWEHGVESVKDAGSSVIGGAQGAQESMERGQEKAEDEIKSRYHSIWKRAQSDPEYRQALDTVISLLQNRLHAALDAADPTKHDDITLASFIADPTPEQHIPKAIAILRILLERLAGNTSLEPVNASVRNAMAEVVRDQRLRAWFDAFFGYAKNALGDVQYARSDEAKATRKGLRKRWESLNSAEENPKWHALVEKVKAEWATFESALKKDKDLNAVKEAQRKLGEDLKMEAGGAFEEIMWFWQDLFKVYLPNVLSQLKDLPIPRTEYKDDDIEFVLENLDISHLNVLPSRVYIRNITDIAIQTSADPSASADRQLATLTHVSLQAMQMHLKDVSFWYKDKRAAMMGEFTGLFEMKLPAQGINVDLKVRMIPARARGKLSRDEQRRFHVVERCAVEISEDLEVSVKESNHPMLANVFSGLVKSRVKQAVEKTLTGQFRALVDWLDRAAYDVGERKKVFEDAGLGGGPSLVAALWSEVGRLEREGEEEGGGVWLKATGTGLVFEEKTEVPVMKTDDDNFEYEVGKETKASVLAVGVEPQVLSGEKRGPLGTGSQGRTAEGMEVDVEGVKERVGGLVEQGKSRVEGFRNAVLRKEKEARKSVGKTWRSDAFDF